MDYTSIFDRNSWFMYSQKCFSCFDVTCCVTDFVGTCFLNVFSDKFHVSHARHNASVQEQPNQQKTDI